jgi:hypothetical protein
MLLNKKCNKEKLSALDTSATELYFSVRSKWQFAHITGSVRSVHCMFRLDMFTLDWCIHFIQAHGQDNKLMIYPPSVSFHIPPAGFQVDVLIRGFPVTQRGHWRPGRFCGETNARLECQPGESSSRSSVVKAVVYKQYVLRKKKVKAGAATSIG